MHPLPSGLATMPDPCSGVPANPWCNGQVLPTHKCVARFVTVNLSVAKRDRFISVSVKVACRKWRLHKAHGRHTRIRLDLGAKGHPQRVGPLPRADPGTIARRNYPVRNGLSPLLRTAAERD